MARTEGFWNNVGNHIKTIFPSGVDILVNGLNKYINFNAVSGVAGYGFRDNNGVMEYKDAAGDWQPFGTGGGAGGARSFGITIDGGGSPITTGLKGYVSIPFAGTITQWDLVADVAGDIVIDIWKDTYANFPPIGADSITGTEKPTLAASQKNQDTALTSWSTAVAAGDQVAFHVDSAATLTRVTLVVWVTPA